MSDTSFESAVATAVKSVVAENYFPGAATATYPVATLLAFAVRGARHFYGNEQASKISTFKKGTPLKGEDGKPTGEFGPAPDDAAVAEFTLRTLEAAHAVAVAGTIGAGREKGEPALSPLDAMIRQVAIEEVEARVTAAGHKMPRGKGTLEIGGTPFTREELVARHIAKQGEALVARANAKLKAQARERAKLAESGASLADLI